MKSGMVGRKGLAACCTGNDFFDAVRQNFEYKTTYQDGSVSEQGGWAPKEKKT